MPAGKCDFCEGEIDSTQKVINANGQSLHAQCFVCHQCFQPLPNGECFPHDNRIYCEHDYQTLFGPCCAGCGEFVVGRCITALDRKWHPEHFNCTVCGESVAAGNFVGRNGAPVCKSCSQKERAKPKEEKATCARCKKPIEGDNYVTLKGQKMCLAHFTCHICQCPLTKGSKEHQGKVFCMADYEKVRVAVCGGCRKPITGRSVSALGKQWHPEHFVCKKCEVPFSGASFYEHDGGALCAQHYQELFADNCFLCNKQIRGETITCMNKTWCIDHFACASCDVTLGHKGAKFIEWDLKPTCSRCYNKFPQPLKKQIKKYDDLEKKVKKKQMN